MWKFIKKETKLKIYGILMEDYQSQMVELKNNRPNMSYKEYRKKYMNIHNRYSATRRKIKKLEQEM